MREALSVQIENPYAPELKDGRCGYGYQLWACSLPGVYRFDGGQGQYGIIWPEKDVVVSIHEGAWAPDGPQATLDAVYDHLLRHLSDTPLPQDETAHRRLLTLEAGLALPDDAPNALPLQRDFSGSYAATDGDAVPWFAVAPPGKGDFFVEFRDPAVPGDVKSLTLAIGDAACELTVNENVRFLARWDGKLTENFAENTVFPALGAYAATARFLARDALEVTIHWLNGWFVTTLRFDREANGRLRIASDQLRLCYGEAGLKGLSHARRTS